jgi:PAS domain S-box-containing protein
MKPDRSTESENLRRRAEEGLQSRTPSADAPRTADEMQRLIHELHVHQIELEMQNEELRNTHAEVAAALERFSDFYDFAPVGYFTLDRNGAIAQTNQAGAGLLGIERALLSGRRFGTFIAGAGLPAFNAFLQEVFATGKHLTCEVELTSKDRPQRSVQIDATLSPDGKECRMVVVDITGRKQMEEALRKSEKKFTTIFQAAPSLIALSTLKEGKIVDVNETALKICGYRREEMVGHTAGELCIWEDLKNRDRMVAALLEQGSVKNLEFRFRNKAGTSLMGLISAELIEIDGEQYMLSLVNDITDRKRAEEEVEMLNMNLAARAEELAAANRELEAFNFTVSHDLRRPLTAINCYAQVVEELCGENLGDECREYLREIYNGTLRMNRLIDTLMDFSRMTIRDLHRETVNLSDMAKEITAGLKMAEPERRVSFLIAEGISVNGDRNLLRVVMDNLLGNAWKYTRVREEAVIEIGMTDYAGKPACFVRDNGIGIDMTQANKLFAPFQRLPCTHVEGYGIGLATVERIIRHHGGKVCAEGELGKGATFYFTLG